jgi:hypothetical protein
VKNLIVNTALLTAVLVGCLALGEIAIRLVSPQQLIVPNDDIWRPDSVIGWRHVENADTHINTGERTVRFRTDANGYRIGEEENVDSHEPGPKILVIGDSFVEATAVEAEQTFAAVLEARLRKSTGLRAVVVNAGVGGWDPNQYLREARTALSENTYQLAVFCLYVGNDIVSRRRHTFDPSTVSARSSFQWPAGLSLGDVRDAWLRPANDVLETRSHLFVLLKNSSRNLATRLGLNSAYFPVVFRKRTSDDKRWGVTSEIAEDIKALLAEHETPVLFILIPTSYQVYPNRFNAFMDQFGISPDSVDLEQPNRLLDQAFERRGLELEDPLSFLRNRASTAAPLYGDIDRHFSPAGHELLGEYLETLAVSKLDSRYRDTQDTR